MSFNKHLCLLTYLLEVFLGRVVHDVIPPSGPVPLTYLLEVFLCRVVHDVVPPLVLYMDTPLLCGVKVIVILNVCKLHELGLIHSGNKKMESCTD